MSETSNSNSQDPDQNQSNPSTSQLPNISANTANDTSADEQFNQKMNKNMIKVDHDNPHDDGDGDDNKSLPNLEDSDISIDDLPATNTTSSLQNSTVKRNLNISCPSPVTNTNNPVSKIASPIVTFISKLATNLELRTVALTAVKNLWAHSLAKTTLIFYFLGYSIIFFLHSAMGKFSVIFTICLHNAFLYLIYTELPSLMRLYPRLCKMRLLIKINHFNKKVKETSELYDMVIRSYYLGISLGLGKFLYQLEIPNHYQHLGMFIMILANFHYSEFLFTALSNPQNLEVKSFILNHSREYHFAMGIAIFEYMLIGWLFPRTTCKFSWVNLLGVVTCLSGEFIRKLGMVTCGTNFSHIVEYQDRNLRKAPKHVLVVNGIYKFVRHPSYMGWFMWSVGSQMVLGNFISFFLFTVASYKFFQERIPEEEETLIEKFGSEYLEYMKRVTFSGVPMLDRF